MPRTKADAVTDLEGAPATKRAVYDAAVRLFARNGFAATGMRELSREAGVNLATVSYFYGSKKGLLKAILDDYFSGVLKILTGSIAGDDAPDVKLRRLVVALTGYFGRERDKLTVALTELPHDDPEITEFKARWFKQLSALLQDGLAGGAGEPASRIPIPIVAPAMIGLAASQFLFSPVLEKVRPQGLRAPDAEDVADMIAELFVNGVNGLLVARSGGRDV